jgi:hypothetical protein
MRAIIHSMPHYDLCLAWNWEYDADFVRLLAATLQARGLSLLPATAADLPRVLTELASGDLTFTAFFDRASESDPRFQPLADWVQARGLFCLNPRRQAFWAADKATMHLEFISRGLDTPYTLLLPPFAGQVSIPRLDLTHQARLWGRRRGRRPGRHLLGPGSRGPPPVPRRKIPFAGPGDSRAPGRTPGLVPRPGL